MNTNSLALHRKLNGKLTITTKLTLKNRNELSLAYTPGVAQIVEEIKKNPASVYQTTIKGNTIAVITDGSAVLGLGNVGALAALPVMEGKCAIFRQFAGLNAFPICLGTQDTDEIIKTIKNIAPVFGGINLEDISAPRCFEIEEKLQDIGIPVIHDDQHGTAITVLAGLLNALKVVKKELATSKIVVAGSGAAGISIAKLLIEAGVKNCLVVDRRGIISKNRAGLPPHKKDLAHLTNPDNTEGSLYDAVQNADVLIGVSTKGLFTQEIIQAMNPGPVIFALANPDPEILPADAKKWGARVIATGRSDYPNQINNALVFPGLFKGLLESHAHELTTKMKLSIAQAIASLTPNPKPGKIISSIFNKQLVPTICATIKNRF